MAKIITKEEACSFIKNGSRVMFGGFLACGSAIGIIDLLATKDIKDLTLIANDTSFPDRGCGKLIVNKQISKVIASHIGTNAETGKQMNNKEIDVTLMPQGSLAECIRAAGAGLGGILTPTGLGTIVQENKQIVKVKDKEYILEEAIHGDVALIYADYADKYGNLAYNGTTVNFNPLMATACDITIAEVKEIVDGCLDPNVIKVPSIFVNYMVKAE